MQNACITSKSEKILDQSIFLEAAWLWELLNLSIYHKDTNRLSFIQDYDW